MKRRDRALRSQPQELFLLPITLAEVFGEWPEILQQRTDLLIVEQAVVRRQIILICLAALLKLVDIFGKPHLLRVPLQEHFIDRMCLSVRLDLHDDVTVLLSEIVGGPQAERRPALDQIGNDDRPVAAVIFQMKLLARQIAAPFNRGVRGVLVKKGTPDIQKRFEISNAAAERLGPAEDRIDRYPMNEILRLGRTEALFSHHRSDLRLRNAAKQVTSDPGDPLFLLYRTHLLHLWARCRY